MGLNWVGTGNFSLDHCIHCSKDKAAVLSAVVAGLLLELCRKDLEFYVTKRKGRREAFYQLSCVLLAASSGHRICYVAVPVPSRRGYVCLHGW